MQIRNGAAAWADPQGASPSNVRYQASFGQLARECTVVGDTLTIKVGVEGRVLVGPKGSSGGNVTVPLRIALVQEGPQPKPLWSKFYPVSVAVPHGQTQVNFNQVEDQVVTPMPANMKDIDSYVIYVGFDPKTAAEQVRPKARPKPKAPHRPAPKAAPKAAAPAQQQPVTGPAPGSFSPPPANPRVPPQPEFAPPPPPGGQ